MKASYNYSLVAILTITFAFFAIVNALAQEKSKKQLKEERKLEQQKKISQFVNAKEFIFEAHTVYPQSGRSIQLTTAYNVEFRPDSIKSYLPFFGRGYSGVGYGGDSGMIFEGKADDFSIEETKKKYEIKVVVKGENDTYTMYLSIYFEGGANLSINTNKRSPISYSGTIVGFPKK
jgi:hypothetical protein